MKNLIILCFCIVAFSNIAFPQSAWLSIQSGTHLNINTLSTRNAVEGYDWFGNPKLMTTHFAAGDSGLILFSPDNGITWNKISSPSNKSIKSLAFINSDSGSAVGEFGLILRIKRDAGNWITNDITIQNPDSAQKKLSCIYTQGYNTLAYVVGDSGAILRTVNSGATWVLYSTTRISKNLNSIYFPDFTRAYAVGDSGTILKSIIQKKWNQQAVPSECSDINLYSVDFCFDTGWVAGGKGIILNTRTGGNIWVTQMSGVDITLRDIFIPEPNDPKFSRKSGWIVGDSGVILKTTDWGVHWTRQESGTKLNLHKIIMLDSLNGIIVGDSGLILRTTLGGEQNPIISVIPGVLHFGTINIGSSKNGAIVISNRGANDLVVSSVTSSNMAFTPIVTTAIVPTEDERELSVLYSPTGNEKDSSIITIIGNFVGSPYHLKAYGSGVDTIATGWKDQNIFALLQSIKSIDRTGSTIVGVGEMGSTLRSSDNGVSWMMKRFNGGTLSQLNGIKFFNSFAGFAIGENGTILKTINGGNDWIKKEINSTLAMTDIVFTNTSVGFLLGRDPNDLYRNIIYRTTDGGETWHLIYHTSNLILYSLSMVDPNTVLALGKIVLRTTNNGDSWSQTIVDKWVGIKKATFLNNSQGIGITNYHLVAGTTDGGITWFPIYTNSARSLNDIIFKDENTGWIYGSEGWVYSTFDGGQSWQATKTQYEVKSIVKVDNVKAVAVVYDLVDNSYALVRCENGIPIEKYNSVAPLYSLMDVSFSDLNNGVAAGLNGTIIRTTNGGQSWSRHLRGTVFNFMNVPFLCAQSINENTITAVGYPASILRTTNGGIDWYAQASGTTTNMNAIYFQDSLNGYCVGNEGLILHTNDGGTVWKKQPSPLNQAFYDVRFVDNSNGIVVGTRGSILQTTNGGTDWTPRESRTVMSLTSVATLGQKAIAIGDKGTVLRSTDCGVSWHQVLSASTESLNDISIGDDSMMAIVGNRGVILQTTDGGINWNKHPSGTEYNLYSVCMSNKNIGTIVGDNGIILNTTTGGGATRRNKMDNQIPERFVLEQNYPNPFNPTTNFQFSIANSQLTILKLYDVLGREVETLVNEVLNPGSYTVKWDASRYSSGVYFYRLQAGSFTDVKKMVLMR